MKSYFSRIPKPLKWIISIAIFIFLYICFSMLNDQLTCITKGRKADKAYQNGNPQDVVTYIKIIESKFGNGNYWGIYDSDSYCINRDLSKDERMMEEAYMLTIDIQEIGYERALRNYQYYLENYPNGAFKDFVQENLSKVVQVLLTDSSSSGKELLSLFYKDACSGTTNSSTITIDLISNSTPQKYWYPEVVSGTAGAASSLSEFRFAVCYEMVQKTTQVENCIYSGTQSGTGVGIASISRYEAQYSVSLVDILSGKIVATNDHVSSLTPPACPEVVSADPLTPYTDIIGKPNIAAISTWIAQQIKTVK